MGHVTLGLVCGLASERALIPRSDHILTGVSGARPEIATKEAQRLVSAGASCLISFGLAGALGPDLTPGTFLLPKTVCDTHGSHWEMDETLRQVFHCEQANPAPIFGSDSLVENLSDKQALFARYTCAAVDMESHRVAEVAAEAGLPCLTLRAVADPANRALPASAAHAIGADGRVRLVPTLLGLLARPLDLPKLIALKADSDAAHSTLKGIDLRRLLDA